MEKKLLFAVFALFVLGVLLTAASGSQPSVGPELAAPSAPPKSPPVTTLAAGAGTPAVSVDTNEITVGAYRACVAAKACDVRHIATDTPTPCNYMETGREAHPMNCVDWQGAADYCAYAGGRLCRGDEWLHACRGSADLDYPYGPTYEKGSCRAAAMSEPDRPMETVAVGTTPRCQNADGLTDMAGNVSEWVDECKGDYCKFYGGAFLVNDPVADFASCKPFCAGNQKTFRSATIGFRCCYDAAAAAR